MIKKLLLVLLVSLFAVGKCQCAEAEKVDETEEKGTNRAALLCGTSL